MEITEVRIKLMDDPHDRLQAFCSITFDACFVVRDLKIIQGSKGSFVAMPSRKLTDRCPRCHTKNHLRALHCNQCGTRLYEDRAVKDHDGRAKLYADIAHPINPDCRELIQCRVLAAYEEELERAKEPGYICSYDDYGEECYASLSNGNGQDEADESSVGSAVSGRDESSRRIEPAAEQPRPPHHGVPSRPAEPAPRSTLPESRGVEPPGSLGVRAATGQYHTAADDRDAFGAGLV